MIQKNSLMFKQKNTNILFFDSALGGLSILNEVIDKIPGNYLYCMDNLYFPYSEKSVEFIQNRLITIIDSFIKKYDISMVVLACNTATTAALDFLRNKFSTITILGVVPPIEKALQYSRTKSIAVIATVGTIQRIKSTYKNITDSIYFLGSTELVNIAENKLRTGKINLLGIRQEIECLLNKDIDTVVCGCTHFPFLIPEMKTILSDNINFIEPSFDVLNILTKIYLPAQNKNTKFNLFFTGECPEIQNNIFKIYPEAIKHI